VEVAAWKAIHMAALDTLPPGRLVVDVETSRFLNDTGVVPGTHALPAQSRAAAVRIATSLGARPGSLETIMKCRDRPPTPEEFASGQRVCRFVGNADVVVLQLGDAKETPEGALVWIALWRSHENEKGEWLHVTAAAEQFIVTTNTDGTLTAKPTGKMSASTW
jgi:hypothetical protein